MNHLSLIASIFSIQHFPQTLNQLSRLIELKMNRTTIGAVSVLFFATCASPAFAEETEVKTKAKTEVSAEVQTALDETALLEQQIDAAARDEELARQTLALYDSLEAQDPFSPRYNKMRLTDPSFKSRDPNEFRLERKARSLSQDERVMPFYEEPWDRNRMTDNRTTREVEMKQRTADKVADMISPGFGRKEFKIGGHARGRFDYIYAGKCRVKGFGMCVHITFQ